MTHRLWMNECIGHFVPWSPDHSIFDGINHDLWIITETVMAILSIQSTPKTCNYLERASGVKKTVTEQTLRYNFCIHIKNNYYF